MGEKIQLIRKENNLSQEELAEKIGVSRQAVSKWELGDSIPDLEKIAIISKLFHISTDSMILETKDLPEDVSLKNDSARFKKMAHQASEVTKKYGYMTGYILIFLGIVNFIFAVLLGIAWIGFSNALVDLLSKFDIPLSLHFLFWIFVIMSLFAIGILIVGILIASKGKKVSLQRTKDRRTKDYEEE
ncbi:MAG: helix-turn-helix domain-containing protein [Peptococcaceae bacterium]|nr:helix-turn-helix domain-containing protein [Peptococcaceae bacterium]